MEPSRKGEAQACRVVLIDPPSPPTPTPDSSAGSGEPINLNLQRLTLDANRRELDELEASVKLTASVPADEDVGAKFLGEALDARGQVDRIADQGVGVPLGAADVAGEHGSGVDPDAVPE